MSNSQTLFDAKIDGVLQAVYKQGWGVFEQACPASLNQALLLDCQSQYDQFSAAGIGRAEQHQLKETIRKDKTLWFNGSHPAQLEYIQLMEALRIAINRRFFMGLFDYECHYARYEQGDYYKKHLDAFKGRSNRLFTTISYLNTPSAGGELVIYQEGSEEILIKVQPKARTLVVFESERFAHEVLASEGTRYSIAGWFRTNNSSSQSIDPSR